MKTTIRINNRELEKSVISQLISQNRKLEVLKYVHDTAGLDLASSKSLVDLIYETDIDFLDDKDADAIIKPTREFDNSKTSQKTDDRRDIYKRNYRGNEPRTGSGKKLLVLALLVLAFLLFVVYYLGGFK